MIDRNDRETDHPTEQRELISRRAYAKHRGWVPSTVVELAQAGKIPLFVGCPACGAICNVTLPACECGEAIAGQVDTRKARINPAIADRVLDAARHPEKQHVAARHAAARGDDDQVNGEQLPLEAGDNVTGFAHWKARSEQAKAETAELELQRKRGELGSLHDMNRAGHAIGRQMREALTGIPDRLAPVLAAEREEARVHHLLLEEITHVLDELYRKLGSTDTAAAG